MKGYLKNKMVDCKKQNKCSAVKCDEEFEISRPHNSGCLYKFFIGHKFNRTIKLLPFPIENLKVLDSCCGSGMISEYYARNGAKVTGIDLSEDAIERARIRKERYKFEAYFRVANATKLPFSDNSFDIVSVHDGLHHLKEPWRAVKEMVRVAKRGVIIIEPAKALVTKISILLGISKKYEDKDFVYRFTKRELENWLKKDSIDKVISKKYIMYYPHKPGIIFKFLGLPVIFTIVKAGFNLINIFFGRFGNKIQVIGLK